MRLSKHGKGQPEPDVKDLLMAAVRYVSNVIAQHGMPRKLEGVDFPIGIEMPNGEAVMFIVTIKRADNDPIPLDTNLADGEWVVVTDESHN